MNNTQKRKAIDELYATLPKIQCQRKCMDCCSTIGMSSLEMKRIVERVGPIKATRSVAHDALGKSVGAHYVIETNSCRLLKDNSCSVYDIRPTICRIWGLVRRWQCPFGCEPDRWMSEEEVTEFMLKVQAISH